MSEAASPSNGTPPPTPPAPDPDAELDPPASQQDADSLAAAAAASPGLLPALGEDLSCLGGGLAAFTGDVLPAGADTDSEYELDDYENVGPALSTCLLA